MDVGRTEGAGGSGRIEGPHKTSKPAQPSSPKAPGASDKVDISAPAGLISKALSLDPVRLDRVAEVKKLVQSGKYQTDAHLEGALDRFLDENSDALK